MAIEWTPWFNVPMYRRLEVLSCAFFLFCGIGVGLIGTAFILYSLIAGNVYLKIMSASYLVFFWFDRHTADRGGRGVGIAWIRNWNIWKHFINYFPIDLVKTADLPPKHNYLVCIFPHGLISYGTAANFGTHHSKWSTLFPGVRPKLTTLSGNFFAPLSREIQLSMGFCGASASSLTILLNQSNDPTDKSNRDGCTSNAVGLIVGGVKEQSYTFKNTYRFFLKNRKGFARIALQTGAPLVPAISFGENDVYRIASSKPARFKRFSGRGFLQYNFGILPLRVPITTVIGSPMDLQRIPNPSDDDINKVHKEFCERLEELFEAHKSNQLKLPGLFRADNKRVDGIMSVSWSNGKFLTWDATCADTFAPSYVHMPSRNCVVIAENSARLKHHLYSPVTEKNFTFVPVAVAVETMGKWYQEPRNFLESTLDQSHFYFKGLA